MACGDWNINLFNNSLTLCPLRVTTNSSSLIDVILRNDIFLPHHNKAVEMGYLDQFAEVMNIAVKLIICMKQKMNC